MGKWRRVDGISRFGAAAMHHAHYLVVGAELKPATTMGSRDFDR